ncbi:MAG: DUF1566 domain-containing protein [Candidatus Woesearchaeota archaeon]
MVFFFRVSLRSGTGNQGSFQLSSGTTDARAVCVRGSTLGINLVDKPKQFVDNGDGTVIDLDTGFVWTKTISDPTIPGFSFSYCNNLELGGFDDWRKPTVSEAVTLNDYSCSAASSTCVGPYRNSVFDTSSANYFWTGTTLANSPLGIYLFSSGISTGQKHPQFPPPQAPVICIRG